jgi:hypothetical protein
LGGGFSVFNISNPAAPVRFADILYPGAFTHNTWTTEDGKFLFTTDETAGGHLKVWDVRNLSSITQVASYEAAPNRIVHNVFVKGNYAYLSYYSEGVKIIDIEDPTYLIEVGSYDTYPQGGGAFYDGCWDLYPYFNSGIITAYDLTNGLFVLSFNNARAGRITGQVTETGSGQPIPDARLRLLDVDKATVSDGNGHFSLRTADGLRQVEVSRFGFVTDTFNVNAVLTDSVTLNPSLTPLPSGTVSGSVAVLGLAAAAPASVSGIRVGLAGDDFFSDTTDASGAFSFNAPAGAGLRIFAGRWGLVPQADSFTLPAGQTVTRIYQLPLGYSDQFEFDQGWTVGDLSDNATSGIWEKVIPVGATSPTNFQTQPASDHTSAPGQFCYITGQAEPNQTFQEHDVDGGKTTLYSPVMDLSDYVSPVLSYWRWFANSAGGNVSQDTFKVEISNTGGASWVVLEQSRFTLNTWIQRQFSVENYLPLTADMLLRVTVSDRQGDSNVEAGLDDLAVSGAPAVRGDFNRDGNVNSADVVILLNAVFLGDPPLSSAEADFNGDCFLNSTDVVIFLNYVFLGQPLGSSC